MLTFITGGAASGKSRYAQERAEACGDNILFVATCLPADQEMKAKVEQHKKDRPPHWTTVEQDRDLASALVPGFDAAIVDCLTLYVSQACFDQKHKEEDIISELAELGQGISYPLFIVSNEVGLGIVPGYDSGRAFRNVLGRVNQALAHRADEVILMVAGIPLWVRREK